MAGTITRRTQLAVSELYDEFKTLVKKEAFDRAFTNLRRAGNRSDRPSKLKALYALLDQCGVAYQKNQPDAYYGQLIRELNEKKVILPYEEMACKMLAAFFRASEKYASPQEYLERLVDRLTDRRWEGDPLRLKLLRQFIAEGDALSYKKQGATGRTQTVYIYNGKPYLESYAEKKLGRPPASSEELTAAMDDGVFGALENATRDDLKPDGKYGLLKMVSDLASVFFRKGGNTKRALYLFAIVFRMTFYTGGADEWSRLPVIRENESDIELNLFVDFYCNNLIRFAQESYDGVKLMQVDTDPSGQGINYKNYAEIIYLYYIARPDMTPAEKLRASNEMLLEVERRQSERISGDSAAKAAGPAADKSTLFYRQNVHGINGGQYNIFAMSEEELLHFICQYYRCDRQQKGFMQLATEQNTAFGIYRELRRRLAIQLRCLAENLDPDADVTVTDRETERYLKTCQEGTWFRDLSWCRGDADALSARIAPYLLPEVYQKEDYGRFARMLNCCQTILGGANGPSRLLFVKSPELITRSALLTTYYYYFITRQSLVGDITDMSFEDVFHLFAGLQPDEDLPEEDTAERDDDGILTLDALRADPARMNPDDGIDTLLQAAYYQPLSGKNILDVMTVFSSYVLSVY